jgi:hypothetical protein
MQMTITKRSTAARTNAAPTHRKLLSAFVTDKRNGLRTRNHCSGSSATAAADRLFGDFGFVDTGA